MVSWTCLWAFAPEQSLTGRVSCVRFSPNPVIPVIVSAGWDKVVKVSERSLPPPPFEMMRSIIFATSEAWPMRQLFPPRSLIYSTFLKTYKKTRSEEWR